MGIYDREYYRDESPGWYSFDGYRAAVGLVAATVAVFLARVFSQPADPVGEFLALNPRAVLDGQVWRLVTATFVTPYNIFAVIFGMITLFFAGRAVEEVYGTKELVAFFVAAGLAVTVPVTALVGLSDRPFARDEDWSELYRVSSAAVSAVLVLFAWNFPYRTVLLFVIPMPAWVLVAILVGLSAVGVLGGQVVPTVLAAGFALAYAWSGVRLTNWLPALPAATAGRPRLRVGPGPDDDDREPVAAAPPRPPAPPAKRVDEQLEAKLDHVLEKVSQFGRESLTAEERDILLRASEVYKKRRGS